MRAAEPDTPRLTVLIPCWNAASTIEGALASVLDEHDVPIECVVIDDGSTDGTADLVQAVADRDPRVVLLRLPANVGVSNARNRGLAVARGEWLAFHDADDRMRPGWFAALMRPTADPTVLAVIGQRIWSDGERTWLSPLYDIPDIREPGRKSIATHPGLLYYVSCTGKAFHRSLLDGLQFEGRVLGDQAWTIRALLRAGGHIEVVGETVFEWSRPHPDRFVATITSVARASATNSVEMAVVARTVFPDVCAEVDAQIDDGPTREAVKSAYFERLIRSDLSPIIGAAIERHDPATGELFEATAAFFEVVPQTILAGSDLLIRRIVWPPIRRWRSLVPSAHASYWRMVRARTRADRKTRYRAGGPLRFPAIAVARLFGEPVGTSAASGVVALVALARHVRMRLGRSLGPR